MTFEVHIGWDPREDLAFQVAAASAMKVSSCNLDIRPLMASHLHAIGVYDRPQLYVDGTRYDIPSRHPAATEFAVTRFAVPIIAKSPWAMFVDCDFLFRRDLADLFEMVDPSKAVMVVKHDYSPAGTVKMDGQTQTAYGRKNWSSLILFNCEHPANKMLTDAKLRGEPGRNLHAFCWLEDDEIGELPLEWNWLEGEAHCEGVEPAAVHFTNGTPNMAGKAMCPYSEEWWEYVARLEGKRWK